MKFTLTVIILTVFCMKLGSAVRIGIVGGGIGGTTAALYLSSYSDVAIHVFEKTERIGGRIESFNMYNRSFELGAAIYHAKNRNIADLVARYEIPTRRGLPKGTRMGIWNGNEFVFESSGWEIVDIAKMLWRYGLGSMRLLRNLPEEMANRFFGVYAQFSAGNAFSDVPQLLEAINLAEYVSQTTSAMFQQHGMKQLLIDELVSAATRCNYVQEADKVNALIGLVSLYASGDDLLAVEGGNALIAERAVQESGATVHLQHTVKAVRRDKSTGKDAVTVQQHNGLLREEHFDFVIVSAPLELAGIEFTPALDPQWTQKREYQLMYTTFISGQVRPQYFGRKSIGDLPEAILSNFAVSAFIQVTRHHVVNDTCNVYKMFSLEPVSAEFLGELFLSGAIVIDSRSWYEVPVSIPQPVFAPFRLAQGLYYTNNFESAMSCMECETVASKNVALLLAQDAKLQKLATDAAGSVHNHHDEM